MKKLGKITSKLLIKKTRKDESVKQSSTSVPEEVKNQIKLKESLADKKKSKKGLGEAFGITKQNKGKKGNKDKKNAHKYRSKCTSHPIGIYAQ